MKSLLITAVLSTGLAHTGAFLEVWSVPYVEDHFTLRDLGRKLDKVTNWNETANALRDRREEMADEHYAMYGAGEARDRDPVVETLTASPSPRRGTERTRMKMRSRTIR